ncbi:hypothetical protein rosag_47240 [Roseisolibacter agri]|uniref:DUF4396 domain-containing protein n=2 Tax=Roseisolibacter agri TaxID=2014610 RepID=A0AA37V8V9_9BACT|nr:hypothetical protein rosag_47240 [Roseisolibacter agri]
MTDSRQLIDVALVAWFALTGLGAAYVAYDAFVRTPEMRVMKWGWLLVTLYTGPVGAAVYVLACQEPAPGAHEQFVRPLWKQALGSTIHCLAGDASGIVFAAAVTAALGLPMGLDLVVEYVLGFAFGLFVFQALFMRGMLGGSYARAVRRAFLPEWLSMNAVMAGMTPVMAVLMSRDMRAMEATSLRFWGVMSLASLVGAAVAYPVNAWLVAVGMKHGMGTERVLGAGGHPIAVERGREARLAAAGTTARGAATPETGAVADTRGPRGEMGAMSHEMPRIAPATPATPAPAQPERHSDGPEDPGVPPAMVHGGMGTPERPAATTAQVAAVTILTVLALGAGTLVAALGGDLTMRPGMPAAPASGHAAPGTGMPAMPGMPPTR